MRKLQKLGVKKNFKKKIAIIGLGYVGLPLAKHLSRYFKVIGYDNYIKRILELKKGFDRNLEFKKKDLLKKNLYFSSNYSEIKNCNIYIITLPTPVNKKNLPDLSLVVRATRKLSKILKRNDLVIYESTFNPGTIDDFLINILEKNTGLKCDKDFYIGYSPERINPGDKKNTITQVKKVIAANNKYTIEIMRQIYSKIVKKGLHESRSIKAAELSKLLENTQRFVNIALMNNISSICKKMDLQTKEVINIASSKWNFNRYYPGFVGGHCVAVDPLYLSYKQKELNLNSKLILAAQLINSKKYIEVFNEIRSSLKNLKSKKFLILGATFKENCPDLRNSGSLNLIKYFNNNNIKPDLHDPYIDSKNISLLKNYNFKLVTNFKSKSYDCIIIFVAHTYYKKMGLKKIKNLSNKNDCLIFDLKSIFNKKDVNFQL